MLITNVLAQLVRRVPSRLCAITGVLLFATAAALAGRPLDVPANFPNVQLQSRMRGEAAITALGAKLPAVAAFYNLSEQELRNRLQRDRDLWVDKYGRLL